MKAILIATIGTRDLMYQIASGSWYNVGDDRLQDGDILAEQTEVLSDFSLPSTSYRNLTAHLWERKEKFVDRLKPAIIGKLFLEQAGEMEKVYLIATDQKPEIPEREKDTLYAAELIKFWLEQNFKHLSENVEIIALGPDGTNPSNFEQMFRWWRKIWREKIAVKPGQPIWACIKGGVGQASEALRISGLSRYQEQIQFFEFQQNTKANRVGIPSDFTGPFLGVNYLWDRVRQQALSLLDRYDYDGVLELLNEGYFKKNPSGWSAVPVLIKAGRAWNQGNFTQFFQLAKSSLVSAEQTRDIKWWWMAYEQAQLAVVRLNQQNTAEAMLHSFRAIEGCLWDWSIATFPDEVKAGENQYSLLSEEILTQYPGLNSCFVDNSGNRFSQIQLRQRSQQALVEAAIAKARSSPDLQAFWSPKAQQARNRLSHRLGGIADTEVFEAWGADIRNAEQWQRRLLNCLNLITGQSFKSLSEAALFARIHQRVVEAIAQYEPTV